MKIPLTKYGWPQVIIFPAVMLTTMVVCLLAALSRLVEMPSWAIISIEMLLAVVLIWSLAFFRDPYRPVPEDKNILLAPADGRITDIEIVDENHFIGGAALRIGIFLSIFDVHINRAPCNVKVENITHKQGKYKGIPKRILSRLGVPINAMNPQSGQVNESNDLSLVRTDSPEDKLIVRQISGAIARRIVCVVRQGQKLTGGKKFGMIKFGSRTELYVPVGSLANSKFKTKCLVRVGDKVKAGLSPLIRYEECPD